MWVDTKAGSVVIETPPNVLGVIDDHWFHRGASLSLDQKVGALD
jgi:hypothetical protein